MRLIYKIITINARIIKKGSSLPWNTVFSLLPDLAGRDVIEAGCGGTPPTSVRDLPHKAVSLHADHRNQARC
jgi:hypothetical protein